METKINGYINVVGTCEIVMQYTAVYSKKTRHSQQLMLEPKGTVGIIIMSDNALAKFFYCVAVPL